MSTDVVRMAAEYRVAVWQSPTGPDGYAALWIVSTTDGQWSLALDGAWANAAERDSLMDGMDDMVRAYVKSATTSPF